MRVSTKECPNHPMVRKALAKEFNKRFRCTGVEDTGCGEEKRKARTISNTLCDDDLHP
jgi:hypothetical protein